MPRLIDADALIHELNNSHYPGAPYVDAGISIAIGKVCDAPTIEERKKGKWTTEEVAELLFNMFGEDCACNFNGIDEWLPERCKYAESTCPDPEEKHGCWMQFLLQWGAKMEREQP